MIGRTIRLYERVVSPKLDHKLILKLFIERWSSINSKIILFGKNQGTQTTQNFLLRLRSARHCPFEVSTPYRGLL